MSSALPPAFAAGALYDTLLQDAFRQFFARATFETEQIPSASSDGRLAIEPTADPCAMAIRWFGWRHILRVPSGPPFTPHEVRFARAIGSVLAARYRAILDPRLMGERGDLFRGLIEDRYVGAFVEGKYAIDAADRRADRLASAIEVLRVAALSSYENRPISSGVLMLGTKDDPCRGRRSSPMAPLYSQVLTSIKSFYRLCDGVHTLFLVNSEGALLDIIDITRWAAQVYGTGTLPVPCAGAYRSHARATLDNQHVCIVLSPSHEIKVFAEGAQIVTFRAASWHLLDIQAKYESWAGATGNKPLAERLFRTALDLADAREGALFVVLREPGQAVPRLIAPGDRLDAEVAGGTGQTAPSRRDLLYLLKNRRVIDLDSSVLSALASMDGATVTDKSGRLLAAGAILLHPPFPEAEGADWMTEGARTTAAITASRFGPVLKVSQDGIISFYDKDGKVWDI